MDSATNQLVAYARSFSTAQLSAPVRAATVDRIVDSIACAIVGSHATRAQGTVGGNLMNASPAMETGGPLVCLAATATSCT